MLRRFCAFHDSPEKVVLAEDIDGEDDAVGKVTELKVDTEHWADSKIFLSFIGALRSQICPVEDLASNGDSPALAIALQVCGALQFQHIYEVKSCGVL